jgi:hypothetical protein
MRIEVYNELGRPNVLQKEMVGKLGRKVRLWMMLWECFQHVYYLYKYWASLDGKTWLNSHKLLNVQPSGGLIPLAVKLK